MDITSTDLRELKDFLANHTNEIFKIYLLRAFPNVDWNQPLSPLHQFDEPVYRRQIETAIVALPVSALSPRLKFA
jgi:hypothetical protein